MNKELGIVIVAGGTSTRYGEKNKLLEEIGSIPIIVHSFLNFGHACLDKQIVLVSNPNYIETYKHLIDKYIPFNSYSYTKGGETRRDSVYNGLLFLKQFPVQYVAIHDAARPFASAKLLTECLNQCKKVGSAVSAKKITDTIKTADDHNKVTATIDRSKLWCIETPQLFNFKDIFDAYSYVRTKNIAVTDDAGAMEYSGKEVFLFENSEYNNKITYPNDLFLANHIYERQKSIR